MDKHSEKGLETLRLLGTKPDDWGLCDIVWKKEKVAVPTKVACPTCSRTGQAYFEKDGSLALNKVNYQKDYYKWQDRAREMHSLRRDRCPTCPAKRNHWGSSYGTGEIVKLVVREVMVGYIQWAKDSVFDSRFDCGGNCQLCNKIILQSGRIPVNGKSPDGVVHNMWVGEDCARKFLGIKKNFKKDQFLKENL